MPRGISPEEGWQAEEAISARSGNYRLLPQEICSTGMPIPAPTIVGGGHLPAGGKSEAGGGSRVVVRGIARLRKLGQKFVQLGSQSFPLPQELFHPLLLWEDRIDGYLFCVGGFGRSVLRMLR